MQDINNFIQPMIALTTIFTIMYFFLIRPQQKQNKKIENLINSLKKGDEIITKSGIIGKIYNIDEKFIILEINEKNKIKILKNYVQDINK